GRRRGGRRGGGRGGRRRRGQRHLLRVVPAATGGQGEDHRSDATCGGRAGDRGAREHCHHNFLPFRTFRALGRRRGHPSLRGRRGSPTQKRRASVGAATGASCRTGWCRHRVPPCCR